MTSMNRSHNNRVPIPILESTPDVFFESAKSYYDGGTEADERLRWYAPTNGVITLSDVSTYGTVTKWGTDFNRQAILYVDNHGLTGDSWTGTTDAGSHSDLTFASGKTVTLSLATSSPGPYSLERANSVDSVPTFSVPASVSGVALTVVTTPILLAITDASGVITEVRTLKQGEITRATGTPATFTAALAETNAQGGSGATLTATFTYNSGDAVYNITSVAVTSGGTLYGSTGSNFIEFLHAERVSNVTQTGHTFPVVDCNLFYPMEVLVEEANHRIKAGESLVPYKTSTATYSPFNSVTSFYYKVINADTLLLRDTNAGYTTFDALAAAVIGKGEYPATAKFRPDTITSSANISLPLHPDLRGILLTTTVAGKYRFEVDAGDRTEDFLAASNYQRIQANTPTFIPYNFSTFFSDFTTKFPFKPVVILKVVGDSSCDYYFQYVAG